VPVRTLVSRGRELRLIELELVELEAGERVVRADEGEVCAVVLGGSVEVRAGGASLGTAGGRSDVFDGAGDAVYVPPRTELALEARSAATVAVASAPVEGGSPGTARIVRGDEQRVAVAGAGNWSRTIRTILGPDDEAGRLIVGETLSPPGNWSSYPPHKHDRQAPPEEAYFYRLRPAGGFAVQLVYDDAGERAHVVHDGDVVAIPSGYHPVAAAAGYELWYLWVLAGDGRELTPFFDPRHAWVQDAGA
jgi:5-deoxy-glucuronate isomerase